MKEGDCKQSAAASDVVMLSWKSTLTHEERHSRKLPQNCCCHYFRKHATTLWKNELREAKDVHKMENHPMDYHMRFPVNVPGVAAVAPRSMEAYGGGGASASP